MTPEQVYSLQLEITSYCNARCPHCARFTADGNLISDLILNHWKVDSVIENFELHKMSALRQIRVEGDKGDPASHPDLLKLLKVFLSHQNHPHVNVVTNGSIRGPDFWKSMANLGPNLNVTFSIDGLQDTNHRYRVGVNWQKIINNAQAFVNAGGNAVWKCLVFQHNQHQLVEIKNLARQMGFSQVYFMIPRLYEFERKTQWLIFDRQQLLGELRPPTDITQSDLDLLGESFKLTPKPSKAKYLNHTLDKICPNLRKGHLYVTYRHHVIPCCMMHNYLYEAKHNSGSRRMIGMTSDLDSLDLSGQSLSNILKSSFFDNALEDHFVAGSHLPVCAASCKKEIIHNLQQKSKY